MKLLRLKNRKRKFIFLAVLISSVLIVKILVWDTENNRWLIQDLYYRPSIDAKLTIATPITSISSINDRSLKTPTVINDASKLNQTQVAAVFQPTNIEEIKSLIKFAKTQGKKISMSGARHSMAGQIVSSDSIHLSMLKFDRISYNQTDRTVTVQSGATWKQIQNELGKSDRAVRVMQDSNIFTVGGSIAVNAHGKDPRFGSLIESVNFFKLINPEGEEIKCSRAENPELFRAAIGGMGLFGAIAEVNLKTDINSTYNYTVVHRPSSEMVVFMESQVKRPELEGIEAQMSVDRSNFLEEAQIYYFDRTATNPNLKDDVMGENSIWLRKLVYRTSRNTDWGKQFRWFMQKNVGPTLDPTQLTRNSSMAAPFRTLDLNDPSTTDILQEYFVPISQVDRFLAEYKKIIRSHDIQLINVTVRKVNRDNEALVSYATEDMYAFVAYYKIARDKSGDIQMSAFTQEMMDYLLSIDAKFYLAYRGYYTKDQLYAMYPKLQELFALKRQLDRDEIFSNKWYEEFR